MRVAVKGVPGSSRSRRRENSAEHLSRMQRAGCPGGGSHHWLLDWENGKHIGRCSKCSAVREFANNMVNPPNAGNTVMMAGTHAHVYEPGEYQNEKEEQGYANSSND